MWFLRLDTFVAIIAISLIMMLINFKKSNIPGKLRRVLLLCMNATLIFFVSFKLFLLYIIYSSLIFIMSRLMKYVPKYRKLVFIFGCILAVIPLFFIRFQTEVIDIIGLAFAVLRAIDVLFYAYFTEEEIELLSYSNFMLFVPTFTAGPLFRFRDFSKELNNLKPVEIQDIVYSVKRIIRGFFKKVVIAQIFSQIFAHFSVDGTEYTLPISFLLIICSYFILYFDIAGYSDIAIGFGRICGFKVPENFKKPWFAASFTLFWRSWHSTVSDWIREHVFILVMNKKLNKITTGLLALGTMVIMSLWHGFSIPYLIAGIYNGALLMVENVLQLTSPAKKRNFVWIVRCFAINFLFAINTLVFSTTVGKTCDIISGLFKLKG